MSSRSRSSPWFAGAAIVSLGLAALVTGPMRLSSQRKVVRSVAEQAEAAMEPREARDLTGDVRQLTYWIHREITEAESPDWAHPSPERLGAISRWADFLRPYNAGLLEVALRDPGNLSEPVRRLLCYTWPDDVLVKGLRLQLHSMPQRAVAAARLLHEHRMLSHGDRRDLGLMLGKLEDPAMREGIAISLTEFGMTEGIEAARQKLLRPLDPLDPQASVADALRAVEVAENLGTRAGSLIPALESKLTELKVHQPEDAGQFEYALKLVKGEMPVPERIAVNGSGYLELPLEPAS